MQKYTVESFAFWKLRVLEKELLMYRINELKVLRNEELQNYKTTKFTNSSTAVRKYRSKELQNCRNIVLQS